MKIRKIKFENHQVLGNLELDFTDEKGNIIDTIILAGENGTGKSLILNALFQISIFNLSLSRDESISFEYNLSENEAKQLISFLKVYLNIEILYIQNSLLEVKIDFSKKDWEQLIIIIHDEDSKLRKIPGNLITTNELRQLFTSIFSDVEINFTPREINTITSTSIDIAQSSVKSSSNLATEITQLLIDSQSQDSLDFSEWARKNVSEIIDQSKLDIRIKRFSQAFEFMFPSKKYKNIETISGRKEVLFEENGKTMNISNLSSGEKQIVFRGSFLLKNKKSTEGAIVLIDEPELSMHPKWQMKIVPFFKMLFTSEANVQTSQIFIATHSPFIIHNASRNKDKVIVLKKDETGIISVSQNPQFYSWSDEIAVKEAFNLAYLLHEHLTTVFVEGETDEKYYKKAMEIYGIDSSKIDFQWIGRSSGKGGTDNSGDRALNNAFAFFKANQNMLIGEVVLLYDSDTNKPEVDSDRIKIRTMSKNEGNKLYKAGVENLLNLPVGFNKDSYNKIIPIIDHKYGADYTKKELDKTKLCDQICDVWSVEQQKVVLQNLKLEIGKLLAPTEVPVEQLN